MGLAHFGARGPVAFAVRFLGARDQTTGGSKRLDPRKAVNLVDGVAQHEAEDFAKAWHRVPQVQGMGVLVFGGCEDGAFDVA